MLTFPTTKKICRKRAMEAVKTFFDPIILFEDFKAGVTNF